MERRLDIAMLGHKRIPSREGGIEVVVEELSTRLVQMGNKVTCYNRSGGHIDGRGQHRQKMAVREYQGIQMKDVPTIDHRGLAAMTSSVSGAIGSAFSGHDVVHFHAEGPSLMCWLPKRLGKRVIVTIHGLDHQRAKWGRAASAYILQGEKNAARYADEIIVLSEGVRQYFKDTYGRDTRFIPNGVDRPKTRPAKLIIEDLGLEKYGYILFLGRIVPEKGLRYLLQAFMQVRTDKKLVIAGGSSDTDLFVKELKEMGERDGRIIFTGFVQGQLLEELYSNAYVYCLPSDLEGMPLSLLEGMSYGNCCLTSDISECAEVVGDKAVLFKKGDVRDLWEKLQGLCDDREIVERYKAGAADYICGKYSWDDMAERTLELYKGRV
ncbi:MAG: glycosyltransferase family 4 protein [Lachnospiraceae bacterium]|nr:glycosyltransferase family 4 protein [Lachnospiraceae bacterium]